ncbi:MAG: guanylate kinase [Chrysothrix sp. TS-e1954]|nr:MAG: guanylate kinase [Chrysothrix sp. TS-e1954]
MSSDALLYGPSSSHPPTHSPSIHTSHRPHRPPVKVRAPQQLTKPPPDTTRPPRPGEQDGREYHFTTPTHFASLLSAHAFIEHAQFGGNSYGTSISTLNAIASTGRTPILDIEMEGVKQISRHPEFSGTARFLFLSPPDLEVLEERLRGRGTDGEEAVGRRLRQARVEIEFARGEGEGVFERVVVNDVLERAYGEVREWVLEG